MYRPMKSASGIEAPIVKVPQALSWRAFTTASPRPASAITMMKRIATAAVAPATGPISARAISASDPPPRRVDAHRMMKSWTAPARQTPATSQIKPGAYPNCAASTGPMSGPAPVIAAKWCPNSTRRCVGW